MRLILVKEAFIIFLIVERALEFRNELCFLEMVGYGLDVAWSSTSFWHLYILLSFGTSFKHGYLFTHV